MKKKKTKKRIFLLTENHEVTKCSLLLSCCGNSYVEKQHEAKLRELEDLLADDEEFEGVCEGMLKIRTRNNIKAAIYELPCMPSLLTHVKGM